MSIKNFLRNLRHSIIIKNISFSDGSCVLDTSCQDGSFLSALSRQYQFQSFGIDINQHDIAIARQKNPTGTYIVADNHHIPFSEKKFDIIISSLTLHHIHHPEVFFNELHRVLTDNGSVYIIDIMSKHNFITWLLKQVRCPEPYHFEKFYSCAEFYHLAQTSGFIITKEISVILFPTSSILAPVMIFKMEKIIYNKNYDA